MAHKLSQIAISHISLVKSGANGKEIIYKSADGKPYVNDIVIKKTDSEKGVVYGIVYSPDQEDSQGDIATAEEIEKASDDFMKNRNTQNIDVNHDGTIVDAFVKENWIVKGGDSIFPDEPIGSWAVAIKLESEELKKMAKDGDIAGLSMLGEAMRTPVEKADDKKDVFKNLWSAIGEAVTGFSIDIWTRVEKGENVSGYKDELVAKLKEASADVEKSVKEVGEKADEQTKLIEKQNKEIEALKKSNDEKDKLLKEQNKKLEELTKSVGEVEETLKKSSQHNNPPKKVEKKNDAQGVL